MLQLVYMSVATDPVTVESMDALCGRSQPNNRRDEITGVLVTRGGRFLQALEGPKEAVEEAFLRIVIDPRHENISLLSRRIVTKREFGEWAMEHFEDGERCADIIAKVATLTEHAPDSIQAVFRQMVSAEA